MATSSVGRTTINGSTTVGGFNPLSLFAAGEQGVWYDPSDLSTMYQDSAGTIPVTAVEQPVGRILDKSGRGNHATQATSANRPVLSARVNLATYSQSLATASAWPVGSDSLTLTNNSAPDPYGGNNATLVVEKAVTTIHFIEQSVSNGVAGLSYTMSCFFKKGTRRYVFLAHGTSGVAYCGAVFDLDGVTATTAANSSGFTASNAQITAVGNGWYRCSVAITQPATTVYIDIGFRQTAYTSGSIYETYTGSTSENGYWFGADLRVTNQGVNLPPYQRVGAATYGTSTAAGNPDYNTNGFPAYLKFDGSNDYLQVTSFSLPLIQRMTAIGFAENAAVANQGCISVYPATGDDYNSQTGYVFSPSNRTSARFSVVGTSGFSYQVDWTTSPASIIPSSVLLEDKQTSAGYLRVNGAQVGSDTSFTQFSANSNGGLLLGVRWNSGAIASPYLNGRMYGVILRGAATTANQITGTENWLNQKTMAY